MVEQLTYKLCKKNLRYSNFEPSFEPVATGGFEL